MRKPRATEKRLDDDDVFSARPDGDGPFPAVLVLHDLAGRDESVLKVCTQLASKGYVASAPLFREATAAGIEGASNEVLTAAVKRRLAELRRRPDVLPFRVGVVGFGIGGFIAFLAACHADAATAVCFYAEGIVRTPEGRKLAPAITMVKRSASPILCLFGTEDSLIPASDVGTLRDRLVARAKLHEMVVYSGAGHGFFLEGHPAYRIEASNDAWLRMLAWLAKTLDAVGPPTLAQDGDPHQLLVSGKAMRVIRSR